MFNERLVFFFLFVFASDFGNNIGNLHKNLTALDASDYNKHMCPERGWDGNEAKYA